MHSIFVGQCLHRCFCVLRVLKKIHKECILKTSRTRMDDIGDQTLKEKLSYVSIKTSEVNTWVFFFFFHCGFAAVEPRSRRQSLRLEPLWSTQCDVPSKGTGLGFVCCFWPSPVRLTLWRPQPLLSGAAALFAPSSCILNTFLLF